MSTAWTPRRGPPQWSSDRSRSSRTSSRGTRSVAASRWHPPHYGFCTKCWRSWVPLSHHPVFKSLTIEHRYNRCSGRASGAARDRAAHFCDEGSALTRAGWSCPAARTLPGTNHFLRSEEHTSELQSRGHLVCRLLLEKKKA